AGELRRPRRRRHEDRLRDRQHRPPGRQREGPAGDLRRNLRHALPQPRPEPRDHDGDGPDRPPAAPRRRPGDARIGVSRREGGYHARRATWLASFVFAGVWLMPEPVNLIQLACGCGGYPVICPAEQAGTEISCPWSGQRMFVRDYTPFGPHDWSTSTDPRTLRACFGALRIRPSDRKLRLLACGLARTLHDPGQNAELAAAVKFGEAVAEGRRVSGVNSIRQTLQGYPKL